MGEGWVDKIEERMRWRWERGIAALKILFLTRNYSVAMVTLRFGGSPGSDTGRIAQRESIGLTSRGSQVQILFRPSIWQNLRNDFKCGDVVQFG